MIDIRRQNRVPSPPNVTGEKNGNKNTQYNFTAISTDMDNNSIRYIFNWSDGTSNTVTNTIQNYTPITVNHTWTSAGLYEIKIYSEDEKSARSEITKKIILIDVYVHFINDAITGYLIDYEMNGTYTIFHNNATGENIEIDKTKNETYMIDFDKDNEYDYTYNIDEGLKTYNIGKDQKGIPGFELFIIFFAIILVMFFIQKRKR